MKQAITILLAASSLAMASELRMIIDEKVPLEKVKRVLTSENKPDGDDMDIGSPLFMAAGSGRLDIVELLVSKGADINKMNMATGAGAPLHSAAYKGHLDVVKFIVNKKANVNLANPKGYNALVLASSAGNEDVVEYLLPLTIGQIGEAYEKAKNEKIKRLIAKAKNYTPPKPVVVKKISIDELIKTGYIDMYYADGTIDDVLKKAKSINKNILLFATQSGCVWCFKQKKLFEKKNEEAFREILNKNFVIVELRSEMPESKQFLDSKNLKVIAMPTLIFVDTDGKKLTSQLMGFTEKNDIFEAAEKANMEAKK